MSRLDRTVVAAAAVRTLVLAVPPVVLVGLVDPDEGGALGSLWTLAVLVGFFVAPLVGGYAAGRRAPRTALSHGAAGVACAFGAIAAASVLLRLVAGTLGLGALVRLVVVVQIAVSLGLVGAWFASRRTLSRRP